MTDLKRFHYTEDERYVREALRSGESSWTTADDEIEYLDTIACLRAGLFHAYDILNGDRDPSNELLTVIDDAAKGYELGWASGGAAADD